MYFYVRINYVVIILNNNFHMGLLKANTNFNQAFLN